MELVGMIMELVDKGSNKFSERNNFVQAQIGHAIEICTPSSTAASLRDEIICTF